MYGARFICNSYVLLILHRRHNYLHSNLITHSGVAIIGSPLWVKQSVTMLQRKWLQTPKPVFGLLNNFLFFRNPFFVVKILLFPVKDLFFDIIKLIGGIFHQTWAFICCFKPVCPDCAIFNTSWQQIFSHKYLLTFVAFWKKRHFVSKNRFGYFWATFGQFGLL